MSGVVTVLDEPTIRRIVAEEIEHQLRPIVAKLAEIGHPPPPNPLVTPREFAAILCVNLRTLHRMELACEVPPAMRIGAKIVRWRREVIDAFVRTGQAESSPKALSIRRKRG